MREKLSKSSNVIVLWPLVGFLLGRKKKPAVAIGALGHQQSEYTNTMFQPPLSCLTPNRFKTIHHKAAAIANTQREEHIFCGNFCWSSSQAFNGVRCEEKIMAQQMPTTILTKTYTHTHLPDVVPVRICNLISCTSCLIFTCLYTYLRM